MAGLAAIHADPLGLLVAFGAGMLSFLSPCVLPLVPAYLSMVSGLSAAELSALRRPRGRRRAPAPQPVDPSRPVPGPGLPETVVPGRPRDRSDPSRRRRRLGAGRAERPTPEELRRHRGRLLRGILAFIAGFTVVFTILGASASSIGRLFTHPPADPRGRLGHPDRACSGRSWWPWRPV